MKALTIYQPRATLIVHGFKRYETRSWQKPLRARIAIHAGRRVLLPRTGSVGSLASAVRLR
jgi:hypothetical protein